MDLDIKRKWVHRIILQAQQTCHKDQPLQHLHIHHKLEDHHGLPQSTIRTWRDIKKCDHQQYTPQDHQGSTETQWKPPMDPPECLENLVKGQDLLKERARCQEPCPGTSSGTGSTAQPAGLSKKHNSMFSMWQKWPLEQKLPLLQFL